MSAQEPDILNRIMAEHMKLEETLRPVVEKADRAVKAAIESGDPARLAEVRAGLKAWAAKVSQWNDSCSVKSRNLELFVRVFSDDADDISAALSRFLEDAEGEEWKNG